MFRILRINTAFFICLAFIFKLFLVNLGLLTSLSANQNKNLAYSQVKSETLNAGHFLFSSYSDKIDYSAIEVCCEEESNDDDQFKSIHFPVSQSYFSINSYNVSNDLEKTNADSKHSICQPVPLYLAFQVFRI